MPTRLEIAEESVWVHTRPDAAGVVALLKDTLIPPPKQSEDANRAGGLQSACKLERHLGLVRDDWRYFGEVPVKIYFVLVETK